jgi:hypothetical protein
MPDEPIGTIQLAQSLLNITSFSLTDEEDTPTEYSKSVKKKI